MAGDDTEDCDDREEPGPVRVDHVGIAVESVAAADPVLRALGCEQVTDETVEGRFRWVYYRLGDASRIELVEPVADDTFLTDFLDERGPGPHHVTLEVADIDAAVAGVEAADADLEVVDRATFEDWHEAFVSPRNPTGTLFQLIEHREGYAEGRGPPADLFVNGERLAARSTAESLAGPDPGEVAAVGEPAAAETRERIAADPFCARFGIDLVALGEGRARTRMRTAPWMANFHGTLHGAAAYALADSAFAAASNAGGDTAVALETNVSYLDGVDPADARLLVADAEALHERGSTAAYRVDVRLLPEAATVGDGSEAESVGDEPGVRVAAFRGRVYRP
jgi:methylmalonyl-CoA/ethylmalonyl-CoA epimerase